MSTDTPHILRTFEVALRRMTEEIMTMGSIAQRNLEMALRGVLERNVDFCNQAIADDSEVDEFERTMDQRGVEVIVRYGPVARDLRAVLSMLKVSTDLERISDQAVSIARRAKHLSDTSAIEETSLIQPLAESVCELLDTSLKAFSEGDIEKAMTVKPSDKLIDARHRELIETMTKAMEKNPSRMKDYMDLILIIRCLERAGDHAVNVAEQAVYLESNVDIRHTYKQTDQPS